MSGVIRSNDEMLKLRTIRGNVAIGCVFDHAALPMMTSSTATSVGEPQSTSMWPIVTGRCNRVLAIDAMGPRTKFHGKNATISTRTARMPKLPTA